MSVTQKSVVDMIEVIESGAVQVRTANRILDENGSVISSSFHRHVVIPGDDYSNEDARVQAICAATHTPELINTYKSSIAAQGV
jgi:hypothetical protein